MSDAPVYPRRQSLVISTFTDRLLCPALDAAEGQRAFAAVSAALTGVANRALFVPHLVYSPVTIYQMAALIGTTSAGNIDVGIYKWATPGGGPSFDRVVSSGSTACGTALARQVFNVTDTLLTPGNYWLAVATDSTSLTMRMLANTQPFPLLSAGLFLASSAFPLPSSVTAQTNAASLGELPVFGAYGWATAL